MLKFTTTLSALHLAVLINAQAFDPGFETFNTNCKACHEVDKAVVGPSLVEIAKLYPRKKSKDFIKWCIKPGKKRLQMVEMPAMAHISEENLKRVHGYILEATKGKDLRVRIAKDLFTKSPTAIQRPRITRTFLPDTGPASMVIALPTSQEHNLIWDTDKCQLRYISIGEIDNFPYLKSNGNSLAKIGKSIYSAEPLFDSDTKPQFKGYEINKKGFPTLHYSWGKTTFSEKISTKDNLITRIITASSDLPVISQKALTGNDKLEVKSTTSGKTLTITYKSL